MELPSENNNMVVCVISGIVVGMIKFLDIYLLTDIYVVVVIKVFITAVVAGLGGVVGKYLFSYLKKKTEELFKKKKHE